MRKKYSKIIDTYMPAEAIRNLPTGAALSVQSITSAKISMPVDWTVSLRNDEGEKGNSTQNKNKRKENPFLAGDLKLSAKTICSTKQKKTIKTKQYLCMYHIALCGWLLIFIYMSEKKTGCGAFITQKSLAENMASPR